MSDYLEPQKRKNIDSEYSKWMETAKELIRREIVLFPDFATMMIVKCGDEVRPYVKNLYDEMRGYVYSNKPDMARYMSPYDEVYAFDVAAINEDKLQIFSLMDKIDDANLHIKGLEDEIERLKKVIDNHTEECAYYADEIIEKICKRAIRFMNKTLCDLFSRGDFSDFAFCDVVAIKFFCQGQSFNEMLGIGAPSLQSYIEDVLDGEIENLPPIERDILYGSALDFRYETDLSEINKKIYEKFMSMLEERLKIKKIQRFVEYYC